MRILKMLFRSFEVGLVIALLWVYHAHKKAKAVVPAPVSHEFAPRISPAVLDDAKRFTVLISNESFGSITRGTGVLIDSTTMLTCDHMLDGAEMWLYTYPVGKVLTGTPIAEDEMHDLALVKLSQPVILDNYAVFDTSVTIGQPVILVGNILGGMKWFVSYGMISERILFYLMTDALSRGGNSGGPWLNTRGEVVAITDWGMEDTNGNPIGVGGGIEAGTIVKFIENSKHPRSLLDMLMGNAANKRHRSLVGRNQ